MIANKYHFLMFFLVFLAIYGRIAAGQSPVGSCSDLVLPVCNDFYVSAYKVYPFRSIENVINITSLDRPFLFAIPQTLPVFVGNSGNYLSTIVFSPATVLADGQATPGDPQEITCQYQGTGIENPQLPSEILAAQSYDFSQCTPSTLNLHPGSVLVIGNSPGASIKSRILDGGNQNNLARVEIRFWLNETGSNCVRDTPAVTQTICSTIGTYHKQYFTHSPNDHSIS
jgi:hypothetical protein